MRLIVNIDVPDVNVAATFYESAFGFERIRPLFNGQIVEMKANGETGSPLIHLLTKPAAGKSPFADGPPRNYGRHWTPLHLDIVVDDLDAALARAARAGAKLERPITDHAWGRIAGIADPFGHGFCLIQLWAEGYDAVA